MPYRQQRGKWFANAPLELKVFAIIMLIGLPLVVAMVFTSGGIRISIP